MTRRIVWGRRNSANVQKVLWAMAELGLEAEVRRVGGGFGGGDAPAYRVMNPTGLVPTLQDGDLTLFESDSIVRYLARHYGMGGLWPQDAGAAALGDQWLTWNASTYYPALRDLFFPMVRVPRAAQKPDALGPQIARLAQVGALLESALTGRDFVAGDAFSIGDIGLGVTACRAGKLPVGAPVFGPATAAWYARVSQRPGFQAHVEQPIGTCLEEWREIEQRVG